MRPFFKSRGNERGAALVEAALILPIFFALVLGMITFGDAYFTRISIEDAVRDGARFGAVMADFDEEVIRERVAGLAGGGLAADDVCVWLVEAPDPEPNVFERCGLGDEDDPPVVDDPGGAEPGDQIVKVFALAEGNIEVIFWSRQIDIKAHSVAPYEAGS